MDRQTTVNDAPSPRNPPQLLRQAGKEECQPRCHLRASTTQDSVGSSSNSTAPTGSSLAATNATTAASWSSSSSDSRFQQTTNTSSVAAPPVGSSSATSSTEETEARERRFGSLDLDPLPSQLVVATLRAPVRCFLRVAAPSTLSPVAGESGHQSQPSVHLVTSGLAVESNLSTAAAGSSSWRTLISDDHQSAAVPLAMVTSDDNPSLRLAFPSDILPPTLWLRLLCPVHSEAFISWLRSRLLPPTDDRQQASPVAEDSTSVAGTQPSLHQVWTSQHSTTLPGSSTATAGANALSPYGLSLADPGGTIPHRIGPYILGQTLGRGNFAVVKLAMHTVTKMLVAVKIMNKHLIGRTSLNKLSRELEAMKRCRHPHIIRLYHVMETKNNIFMITEYASKGEVFDHVSMSRAFSEKEARELFWQLACAIAFCHQSGVVHRDLKAENLLLDEDFNIKVADFGFCNFFQNNELLSTHCGSPQYAAPELFKGEPYDGPLADVWSLGVILYILVCGSFPFPGESLGDIRIQVLRGLVRFPFFLSTACEQVIRCMLQVDPTKRFKLQEVIKMPWMQASPKVKHYSQLLSNYEARVKQHMFDELFKRQYPKHSQVVHVDQSKRAERALDTGVLCALSLCSGLEEQQVRYSTLLNLCDHHHACYQLLLAKIRRFRRSQPLRCAVNEAVGVPFVGGEEGAHVETSGTGTGGAQETTGHRLGEWEDPEKPDSTLLKVAQFILKADEESLLASRGLTSGQLTSQTLLRSGLNESVRRHTVQLSSPLTLLDLASPPGGRDPSTALGASIEGQQCDSQPARFPPYPFPRQTTQPQIFTGGRQPRTRQGNQLRTALEGFPNPWELKTGQQQSADTSSGVKLLGDTNRKTGNNTNITSTDNNTSLELGEEAASSSSGGCVRSTVPLIRSLLPPPPPSSCLRRLRVGLRRDNSIVEYEDDTGVGGDGGVPDAEDGGGGYRLQASSMGGGTISPVVDLSCTTGTARASSIRLQEHSFASSLPFPVAMETDAHDAAMEVFQEQHQQQRLSLSSQPGYDQLTDEMSPTGNLGDPGMIVVGGVDGACAGDSGYLPQLNLPTANLPAMMHQPMARFTVKDPHLLAPPEFMTPCCSSFPRRSSDGAADLQPLQRPTIMVGGSYPEQANYRDNVEVVTPHVSINPTATTFEGASLLHCQTSLTGDVVRPDPVPAGEFEFSTVAGAGAPVVASSPSPVARPRLLPTGRSHTHHWHHHISGRFRPSAGSCSTSSATAARQQRIRALLAASLRHSRFAYRSPGAGPPQSVDVGDGEEQGGGGEEQGVKEDGLVPSHLKRFSLPVGYRLHLARSSGDGSSQSNSCLCHQPPSPEMWQQIQQRLVLSSVETVSRSLPQRGQHTEASGLETGDRRGSEASQLLAWNERLSQLYECSPLSESSPPPAELSPTGPLSKVIQQDHLFGVSPEQGSAHAQQRIPVTTAIDAAGVASDPEGATVAVGFPPPRSSKVSREKKQQQHFRMPTSASIELTDLEKELHYLETEDRQEGETEDPRQQYQQYLFGIGLPLGPPTDRGEESVWPGIVDAPHPTRSSHSTLPPSGLGRQQQHLLQPRTTDTPVRVRLVPRRALSVALVSSSRGHTLPLPPLQQEHQQQQQKPQGRFGQSLGERLDFSHVLPMNTGDDGQAGQLGTDHPAAMFPTSPTGHPKLGSHSPLGGGHRTLRVSLSNPDHRSTTVYRMKPTSSPLNISRETSPRQRKRSATSNNNNNTTNNNSTTDGGLFHLQHQPQGQPSPQSQAANTNAESSSRCSSSAMLLDPEVEDSAGGRLPNDLVLLSEEACLQATGSREFFASPKRKVCQEWLLKMDAFSKLGTPGGPDVGPDQQTGDRPEDDLVMMPPTGFDEDEAMPDTSVVVQDDAERVSQGEDSETSDVQEDPQEEEEEEEEEESSDHEEEGHCYLAPLQSHLSQSVFHSGEHHFLCPSPGDSLCLIGIDPILEDNLLSAPPVASGGSQMMSMLMMLRPQANDDDDDLVEIERVNRRLALSRMSKSTSAAAQPPSSGFFQANQKPPSDGSQI